MYTLANCTISIYRGTAVNEFGDETAVNTTPVASKVVAFIRLGGSLPHDLNEQVPRVTRMVGGFVGVEVDVRTRDRIVHEQTGAQYWVRYVNRQETSGWTVDTELNLEKID